VLKLVAFLIYEIKHLYVVLFDMLYLFVAVTLATQRDGSSGGVVRLGVITEKGIQREVILPADMPKFYEG